MRKLIPALLIVLVISCDKKGSSPSPAPNEPVPSVDSFSPNKITVLDDGVVYYLSGIRDDALPINYVPNNEVYSKLYWGMRPSTRTYEYEPNVAFGNSIHTEGKSFNLFIGNKGTVGAIKGVYNQELPYNAGYYYERDGKKWELDTVSITITDVRDNMKYGHNYIKGYFTAMSRELVFNGTTTYDKKVVKTITGTFECNETIFAGYY